LVIYKRDTNITILQTNRWNEILDRAVKKGEDTGFSKEFIVDILMRCIWKASATRIK
jgi:uncharacterized protein YggE